MENIRIYKTCEFLLIIVKEECGFVAFGNLNATYYACCGEKEETS